jgi:hypothetical protein
MALLITVSQKEFTKLLLRSEWLGYLEAAGVDNWEGCEHAADEAREAGYFERRDAVED